MNFGGDDDEAAVPDSQLISSENLCAWENADTRSLCVVSKTKRIYVAQCYAVSMLVPICLAPKINGKYIFTLIHVSDVLARTLRALRASRWIFIFILCSLRERRPVVGGVKEEKAFRKCRK